MSINQYNPFTISGEYNRPEQNGCVWTHKAGDRVIMGVSIF